MSKPEPVCKTCHEEHATGGPGTFVQDPGTPPLKCFVCGDKIPAGTPFHVTMAWRGTITL